MTDPLLAEDLLLLLLDDEKGTLPWVNVDVRVPLGAAVLAELAIDGAVELEPATSRWRRPTVQETTAASDDDVLADALAIVAEKPRSADDLAPRVGKDLKERLGDRLVAQGVLERQDDRVLGLFPRTRWPARSVTREAEVRRRLEDVVVRGAAADERTAALAGILQALDRLAPTLGLRGAEARDARRRVKDLAEGDWAAKVVRDAVQAAIVAATTAGSTAATSSVVISP